MPSLLLISASLALAQSGTIVELEHAEFLDSADSLAPKQWVVRPFEASQYQLSDALQLRFSLPMELLGPNAALHIRLTDLGHIGQLVEQQ